MRLEGISGSSGSRPLLKQSHLEQTVPQNHIQILWSISRDGDSTASLSNLHQCLVTCPFTQKKCFLMFRQNLQCVTLCPLALVLSQSSTERCLVLRPFHPPSLKGAVHTDEIHFILHAELAQPSHSSLGCSSPIIHLSDLWWAPCMSWLAQLLTQHSRHGLNRAESRARISSLNLLMCSS